MKHQIPRKERKVAKLEEVQLVGVPHYTQGEADNLCAYYTMSMMLASLHPEWTLSMHEPPRNSWQGSPVFQGLRRLYKSEGLFKEKVADWFFHGMPTTEVTEILNQYFQQHLGSNVAYFSRHLVRARRSNRLKTSRQKAAVAGAWNIVDVINILSWSLPVMISAGGLGSHTVVAIGYSVRGSSDRMICCLDPGLVRPAWLSCASIFVDDAEVIVPNENEFRKYRPARVMRVNGKAKFEIWKEGFLDE